MTNDILIRIRINTEDSFNTMAYYATEGELRFRLTEIEKTREELHKKVDALINNALFYHAQDVKEDEL